MSRRHLPIFEYGKSVGEEVLENVGRIGARFQERQSLDADVLEGAEEYVVVFDAPGAESRDVQVSYDEGTVGVRIDRFRPFREDFDMRFPGRGLTLSGEATLPRDATVREAEATAELHANGTLRVHLPKGDSEPTTDDAA